MDRSKSLDRLMAIRYLPRTGYREAAKPTTQCVSDAPRWRPSDAVLALSRTRGRQVPGFGSGSRGRFPAPGPHRSGRAQLTHPAPRDTDSLRDATRYALRPLSAAVALRWQRSSVSPAIFPSGGSVSRRPLSSTGSSEGEFPRVAGTMRRSDSRPPIPPRFVSFAWRYATKARSTGPPRFLGSPRARAGLFDPGGTESVRPLRRFGAAFRLSHDVGPHDDVYFGAQSHGPRTRCLRFAGRVAPPPRKTRFRLTASFAGRD